MHMHRADGARGTFERMRAALRRFEILRIDEGADRARIVGMHFDVLAQQTQVQRQIATDVVDGAIGIEGRTDAVAHGPHVGHGLVGRELARAPGLQPPALAQPAHQDCEQGVGVDRLGDVIVHARVETAPAVFAEHIGRHREDGHGRAARGGTDGARGIEAIHFWHLHVHQDDVVIVLCRKRDGARAVLRQIGLQPDAAQQFERDHLIDRVVFGQQHARMGVIAFEHRRRAQGLARRVEHRCRQRARATAQPRGDPEGAAHAHGARHTDFAAHHLGQLAVDRKTESGAAVTAGGRAVGLLESREQAAQLVGLDADAFVLHFPAHEQIGRGRLQHARAQRDRAARRELDGIVDVVEQHLTQARRIAAQVFGQFAEIDLAAQALGMHIGGHQRTHPLDDLGDAEVDFVEDDLLRLDLGQIEHIVDDREQMVGRAGNPGEFVGLFGAACAGPQQMRQTDDGVHRRADLMAHVGQEDALGLVRRFSFVSAVREFRVEVGEAARRMLELGDVAVMPKAAKPAPSDFDAQISALENAAVFEGDLFAAHAFVALDDGRNASFGRVAVGVARRDHARQFVDRQIGQGIGRPVDAEHAAIDLVRKLDPALVRDHEDAIGQGGQDRIEAAQGGAQGIARAAAFGVVEPGRARMQQAPVVVVDRHRVEHNRQGAAVGAHDFVFDVAQIAGALEMLAGHAHARRIAGRDQIQQMPLADQFLARIAKQAQGGVVDRNENAVRVERVITARRAVVEVGDFFGALGELRVRCLQGGRAFGHQVFEAQTIAVEFFAIAMAFRDIDHRPHRRAVVGRQQGAAQIDPQGRAVLAHQFDFLAHALAVDQRRIGERAEGLVSGIARIGDAGR